MATKAEVKDAPKEAAAAPADAKPGDVITAPDLGSFMTEALKLELEALSSTQRAAVLMLLLGEQQAS